MFEPASPNLNGHQLLGAPLRQVKDLLQNQDEDLIIDSDGAVSLRLGVSLYVNGIESGNEPVEGVMVLLQRHSLEVKKQGGALISVHRPAFLQSETLKSQLKKYAKMAIEAT
ncbi:hypothetical protein LCM20_01885 [Halobacillus litoralis]|uniref:hypothetical protein n=1 Tax=Halobacillus litoralis TaxID=45668 RepID=UPI001CD7AFB8|nr:hypothetical protein [Halobacillus litoralis]MCA0969338.1 hypothetical protein [Halobacillus litoralis]